LITLARWQVTSEKKRQEKKNFGKQDGVNLLFASLEILVLGALSGFDFFDAFGVLGALSSVLNLT
jgi:hypothetical protein